MRPRIQGRSKVRNLRTIVANTRQLVGWPWRLQKGAAASGATAAAAPGNL